MNDTILIKEYLSWNKESLEKLLEKHLQSIFSICFRICLDKDDANDICQNVLIKIINNLKNFKFKSEFKTWYFRIAYNESINFLKSRKIDLNFEEFFDYTWDTKSLKKDLNDKILKEKITQEINKLPLIERNIILYYYFDDLKIKEILEIMQINENTIKTKLKRTKDYLQTKFKYYEKFD